MADLEFHHFDCACADYAHSIRFVYDPDDAELHLEVHLNNYLPWYRRIWPAIKHVLGMQVKWGHYDVTLLKEEDYVRLHELMDRSLQKGRELRMKALPGPQEKLLLKG